MPFLGAHMPTSGGLHLVFDRIAAVGGEALQLFTRNQRQWAGTSITDAEAEAFAAGWKRWGREHIFAHASYLINLASPDETLWRKSASALAREFIRCARLNIPWVVLHPGSHKGAGRNDGCIRAAACLDMAFEEAGDQAGDVGLLLENTSGTGTALGADPEDLAEMISASEHALRLGICWDTCHGFAAGHDPRHQDSWAEVTSRLDRTVGLSRLQLLHLNDSKTPLGSRRDRHEHIGLGEIGFAGFSTILNDPPLAHLPMVLETPKGSDLAEDIENLNVLRGLLKAVPEENL
ncbi:Endonuclease IV [Desulfonatronum thiosulfatophilum]|uniref:Probable endonuclease 4 n=1 Tax=Desulfonatronum thiosulfatophilum TaxID=617002 RepID=A0A1G6DH99_9BACT|nr:deoxyribonuclease IV [Desulfonatronum thiosulfatophilum]SDB44534.1 Endonuclease IV [Desulfonatronum thiosulfatophilum]